MATESDILSDLVKSKYRHGFVTDIEQETVPPGLNEDVIRLISAKKGEPEFLTEWRLKAYRHWLTQTRARVGARALCADRLSGDLVLLGAEERRPTRRRASTRSTRSCSRPTTSSAFRCTSARASPASPSMPCSTASPSRRRSRTSSQPPA